MNNAYEYDVEIYPNLFEVTFIPKTADQKLIDVYKAVDIRCLAIKNGKEGNLEELKEAKAKLLLAMGAKQFVIWIDYTTGKWRNDGPLIMDFFIQHKILTGYNSNNYDKIMLDIFINNYKYLDENDTIKFVCGSIEDLEKTKNIIDTYNLKNRCHLYISPVFGTIELPKIVDFMIENNMTDVNMQLQLHKYIWSPDKKGV